ncbi:hypothetical protein I3760_11G120400 [Carya illinoinensis]|nr:hypothetical protein I3760_11G120400 [Carya illinoinensis]
MKRKNTSPIHLKSDPLPLNLLANTSPLSLSLTVRVCVTSKEGMEKSREHKEKQHERPKSLVWDCGSSLYDSFELNSFKRQLDSAISRRTMSMPHLPDGRAPPKPQPPPSVPKKPSKISRSLQKLLRSVFKAKPTSTSVLNVQNQSKEGTFYVHVYDKSGALNTIPEVPEFDFSGISPEIGSLVRKSTSERFTATSIGISCA